MESRPGEDQTIDQRHRDAYRHSLLHVFQHAAANRAMDVETIVDARVSCGNYVRLTIDVESDVADQCFVDDGVDGVTVVAAAVALAGNGGARGLGQSGLR